MAVVVAAVGLYRRRSEEEGGGVSRPRRSHAEARDEGGGSNWRAL
jgi:hypothetical protein